MYMYLLLYLQRQSKQMLSLMTVQSRMQRPLGYWRWEMDNVIESCLSIYNDKITLVHFTDFQLWLFMQISGIKECNTSISFLVPIMVTQPGHLPSYAIFGAWYESIQDCLSNHSALVDDFDNNKLHVSILSDTFHYNSMPQHIGNDFVLICLQPEIFITPIF